MIEFTTSNWISLVSTLISLIALIKSFMADRKTKKIDFILKQQQLQQNEYQITENKKADVEVNAIKSSNGYSGVLKFYNKGKAVAFNVAFTIPSDDGIDDIYLSMPDDYLPYPKLQPQQGFNVKFHNNSQVAHQTIHMVWDDDFSKGRTKDMVIDM